MAAGLKGHVRFRSGSIQVLSCFSPWLSCVFSVVKAPAGKLPVLPAPGTHGRGRGAAHAAQSGVSWRKSRMLPLVSGRMAGGGTADRHCSTHRRGGTLQVALAAL